MEDEREEEIASLLSIFPEITLSDRDRYRLALFIPVAPTSPISLRTQLQDPIRNDQDGRPCTVNYLPALKLVAELPKGYPDDLPPRVTLETQHSWLRSKKLEELQKDCERLWEEYGHMQVLFSYIDHLQQAAERFFDLEPFILTPPDLANKLVRFSELRDKELFEKGNYDCGVCLEPKQGTTCHRMRSCGHIFCRPCLQDFYNSAITEGDVGNVTCLEPSCGKDKSGEAQKPKAVHPGELLELGITEAHARRYVELKRKKKLESDKSTIFCPRQWCQAPARNDKYPPIPDNLEDYVDESSDEATEPPPAYTKDTPEKQHPAPGDRLVICSNPKCQLAYCRVCFCGWHGEFARCWPRDPSDLSEEEKASYEYIRQHTSPCPTCASPVQKTMGCNHMKCFQCNTHFCYLCSAWLEPDNPYQHFNNKGNECYMRLWELEEGDEGQGNANFQGARRYEREAIEIARQAQEEEDAQVAAEAQAQEADGAAVDLDDPEVQAHVRVERARQDEHLDRRRFRRRVDVLQRERHWQFFAHLAPPPGPIDPMHAMVLQMEQIRVDEEEEARQREQALAAPPPPPAEQAREHPQRRGRGRRPRGGGHMPQPPQHGHGDAGQQRDRERGDGGGRRGRRGPAAAAAAPAAPAAPVQAADPAQVQARQEAALRRFVQMAQNDEEDEWDSDELEDDGLFIIR